MSDISNTDLAIQNRKFAKTCVEKKRRDRINKCLDELKDLMAQADDKARYQKMEKAEILEMAVTYMKNLDKTNPGGLASCLAAAADAAQSPNSSNNQNESLKYYTMAYRQCLNEFQNFLCVFPGINDDFKSNIMNYMSQRYIDILSQANQASQQSTSNALPNSLGPDGDLNNSSYRVNPKLKNKSNRHSPYYQSNMSNKKISKNTMRKQMSSSDDDRILNMMSITANTTCNTMNTSSSSSASSSLSSSSSSMSCSPNEQHITTNNNNINKRSESPDALSNTSSCCDPEADGESSGGLLLLPNESGILYSSPAASSCSSPCSSSSGSKHNHQQHHHINNNSSSAKLSSLNQEQTTQALINIANFNFYQSCFMKVWRPW